MICVWSANKRAANQRPPSPTPGHYLMWSDIKICVYHCGGQPLTSYHICQPIRGWPIRSLTYIMLMFSTTHIFVQHTSTRSKFQCSRLNIEFSTLALCLLPRHSDLQSIINVVPSWLISCQKMLNEATSWSDKEQQIKLLLITLTTHREPKRDIRRE